MFEFNVNSMKEDNLKVFIDMIPYVSPKITNIDKGEDKVIIACEDSCNDEIKQELQRLVTIIESMKDSKIETIVLEDFTDKKPLNNKDIFSDLLNDRTVRELSPGVFSYSGLFLKIYEYFDKKINEYAYKTFNNLTEEVYPVLFPVQEYVKGRYFENFPHYMMFQTKLNNNIDTYEKFMSRKPMCSCVDEVLNDTTLPKNVLRHATCAPVYPSLENHSLEENEVKAFLVSGRCFRNEELNIKELSRLNEFNMKEYVFIGEAGSLEPLIEESKKLTRFWIDVFSLNSRCETANDSFFASSYKKLRYFQLIGNSKLEYRILVPSNGDYVSCCSVNFHRTHFSKPYNIRTHNGDYAYTACYAFGVERLTYTLLSQKGLDISKWDQETIDEISKYVSL